MTDYVSLLRNFIKSEGADAILINSADEFLSEYNQLPKNSRYKVTAFSGSTGDCVVTQDRVFLFVDGRYHEQADNEVNHDVVTVVKLKQGESNINSIVDVLKNDITLIVTANKVSVSFAENISESAKSKNIKIKFINYDPVDDKSCQENNSELIFVPEKITKYSPEQKFRSLGLKEGQYLIITYPCDFAYFTNLRNYDFPYSSAPRAKAIISEKSVTLYTDGKVPYNFDGLSVKKLSSFREDLSEIKNSTLFIDKQNINYSDFTAVDKSNSISASEVFEAKSHKNENEIAHLKEAFKATDRVVFKMNRLINESENITEYDLFCAINRFFEEEGAVAQSFKPIIASGSNSSIIHYSFASDKKTIKDGELVMVDCGGYFEGGLATDITRTFIKGTPNEGQKHVYTMVLKAFIKAYTKKYTEDATWFDIDNTAREFLKTEEKTGYLFNHSTGHGIGISVHERPPICAPFDAYKQKFDKNYVFSIEPGLYKAGEGGVRLENAVYTEQISPELKITALSHYPFEEKLIDFSLLDDFEKNFLNEWQEYGRQNNLIV